MTDVTHDQRDSSSKTWHTVCPYNLRKATDEGRLVSAWAVQVKSLVARHFVPNGLLVDMLAVSYVDSVGELLLLWLRDLHARFVAGTCYARDICERLNLTFKGDADRLSRQRPRCFPCPQ